LSIIQEGHAPRRNTTVPTAISANGVPIRAAASAGAREDVPQKGKGFLTDWPVARKIGVQTAGSQFPSPGFSSASVLYRGMGADVPCLSLVSTVHTQEEKPGVGKADVLIAI